YRALLPTLGALLVIAAGPSATLNRVLLSNRPAVWIGRISYPLYLWHWPVLTFARFMNAELPSPWQRLGLLVASGILAWLTYRFIELPVRFGSPRRWQFVTPLAGLIVLGLLGQNIYLRDGLEFRKANRGLPGMAAAADGWYRLHDCLLDPPDMARMASGQKTFSKVCDGGAADSGRPLILIWGDSHAASLYPGLHAYALQHGFDVAQFTGSACPPIVEGDIPDKPKGCDELGKVALRKITELKPAIVVLAGYWSRYQAPAAATNGIYPALAGTLNSIRQLSPARIVLVGHLPTFFDKQAGIGVRMFEPGKRDRTYKGFDERSRASDGLVRTIAATAGVSFFSPIDLLCNAGGCLLSTSDRELKPIAWDYGHLTAWGSEFLIGKAVEASPELFAATTGVAPNRDTARP
ncbi:MAG TPA: acyltransferase family protein, partial [Burkholderiaceae bacterium]